MKFLRSFCVKNILGPKFTAEAICGDLIYTFSKTNITHRQHNLHFCCVLLKNAKFLLIGFKSGFSLKTYDSLFETFDSVFDSLFDLGVKRTIMFARSIT